MTNIYNDKGMLLTVVFFPDPKAHLGLVALLDTHTHIYILIPLGIHQGLTTKVEVDCLMV